MSETNIQTRRSLSARLVSGALWSVAAAVVTHGSSLAGALIAARLLGREGYGELGVVNGTIATLGTFTGMGLSTTALRYVAELRSTDRERAGRILALAHHFAFATGGLVALGLVVAGPLLARTLLNAPHLGFQVQISAILVLFGAVNGVQTGALSGFEAFGALTRISIARAAFSISGVLLGAIAGGLSGIVIANSAVAVIGYVLHGVVLRRVAASAGIVLARPRRADLVVLREVAAPAFLASVFAGPVGWIGTTLLVNQPAGYAEMGIFNAASQWRFFVMFVPAAIAPAGLPAMTELHGQGDGARFRKALAFNFATTLGGALAAAVPVVLLSGQIMSMYGTSFVEGGSTLILLAISAVLHAASTPAGNALLSWNRYWHALWINVGWATVFIVVAAAWVSRGAVGLAAAYAVSYAVHAVVSGVYMAVAMRSKGPLREYARAIE